MGEREERETGGDRERGRRIWEEGRGGGKGSRIERGGGYGRREGEEDGKGIGRESGRGDGRGG